MPEALLANVPRGRFRFTYYPYVVEASGQHGDQTEDLDANPLSTSIMFSVDAA